MNYKSKYLKYKLKYLTAKKLYGGMKVDYRDSQERKEEELNEEKKKAEQAKAKGKRDPTTNKTPIATHGKPKAVFSLKPTKIEKPSTGNLGKSPSAESDKAQNSEMDYDFSIGTPEIPLKKI